jgi:acyl carrier protein
MLVALLHSVVPATATVELDDSTDLFVLGLDSLKAVEFALAIEDAYNITFDLAAVSMDDLRCLRTIRRLLVENYGSQHAVAAK